MLAGGLTMSLVWLLVSILAFVSIVGIPWGRACWTISELAFKPFGREAISRRDLTQRNDIGTSVFGSIGNVIWFIFAGVWLALGHAVSGALCCATIIGIPFGIQHFKLAGIAVAPIGKTIVTTELAAVARDTNAKSELARLRSN
jgi:uncharacterized membrane protein YccF (DUF307 family)